MIVLIPLISFHTTPVNEIARATGERKVCWVKILVPDQNCRVELQFGYYAGEHSEGSIYRVPRTLPIE